MTGFLNRHSEALLLLLILALASFVRIDGLSLWYFNWDEIWHFLDAKTDGVTTLLARNLGAEVHGPVYYLLLYTLDQFTDSLALLRGASVLPGVLLVLIIYGLCSELFDNKAVGLCAALIIAVGESSVVLSQVIRGYALATLLLYAAVLCMVCFLKSQKTRYFHLLLCCSFFASMTEYYAFFLSSALCGSLFAYKIVKREFSYIHLLLAIIVFLIPAVYGFMQLGNVTASKGQEETFRGFYASFLHLHPLFVDSFKDVLLNSFLFPDASIFGQHTARRTFGVLFVIGFVLLFCQRRWLPVCLFLILVATAIGLSISGLYPYAPTRHCAPLMPLFLIPILAFVPYVPRVVSNTTVSVLVVLCFVTLRGDTYRTFQNGFTTKRADFQESMEWIEKQPRQKVVLLSLVETRYIIFEQIHFMHEKNHPEHFLPYDTWVADQQRTFRGTDFYTCHKEMHGWSYFILAKDKGWKILYSCLRKVAKISDMNEAAVYLFVGMREPFFQLFQKNVCSTPSEDCPAQSMYAHKQWKKFFMAADIAMKTETTMVLKLDREFVRELTLIRGTLRSLLGPGDLAPSE